jgi:phosphohistidine phosphatase
VIITLYLLRHADAGDPADWHGDDDLRPLSDKGVRQAERLGRHLAAAGVAPDVLLTSPKVRARRTAEIVGAALGVEAQLEPRLGGPLDATLVGRILAAAGSPRRPLLVGHDPDFSDLAGALVGATSVSMKKGALVRIDLPGDLVPGTGVLRWLIPPDALAR